MGVLTLWDPVGGRLGDSKFVVVAKMEIVEQRMRRAEVIRRDGILSDAIRRL